MSEDTQQPEEQAENTAAPQAETTPETTETKEPKPEAVEAVEEETTDEAPVEPFVVLTERPALAEPGEFDWDAFETDLDEYDASERKELETTYEDSLTLIKEKEVVDGTIVTITKKEVVVNIGYKSEGVITASEFRYNPDLKPGDQVAVFIEKTEDLKWSACCESPYSSCLRGLG